uniref:Uncharacterized protein n=1 Tax=Wuchereria bancrofti TaxID=6293 RepID=A0A1I8EKU8_WUCBA
IEIETNLITNAPHPGFSDSYDFIGHTNLESSLDTDMDSYTNIWRNADRELKTGDDNVRYPFIRVYFHQLTLSSDDTCSQSATDEISTFRIA